MSNGILSVIRQAGIYSAYQRHIVMLEPILRRMSARGFPVDPAEFAKVKAAIEGDLSRLMASMQALVPDEIKSRKAYKKEPRSKEPTKDGTIKWFDGERWWSVKQWSPSNKGLLAYIKYRGHTVPKDRKKGKETTNKLEVARLYRQTKDPLYKAVLEYRKAETIRSNHIKNWEPGEDGTVHSTFYYDPASGQLSSRRPNVQNAPARDDPEFGGYAKVFRSMIKAREGHSIVELDFSSFHAQTTAFEAEDPDYLRLAKLDVHSFLTAHLIREPRAGVCITWPDDQLREYLAWIKANHKYIRDEKAKRAILGWQFGMGAGKLYDMNKESFANLSEAKRTIAMLEDVLPIAARWRTTIRQKAHDQGYLISRHGYIRYFREVFNVKWVNGHQVMKPGDDSESAIAFLPSNDAHGEMKERILTMSSQGLDYRYNFVNCIHDSLVFECPNNLLDECVSRMSIIMVSPSRTLINRICPNGLSVEVEAKVGPNWADMKKYQRIQ